MGQHWLDIIKIKLDDEIKENPKIKMKSVKHDQPIHIYAFSEMNYLHGFSGFNNR